MLAGGAETEGRRHNADLGEAGAGKASHSSARSRGCRGRRLRPGFTTGTTWRRTKPRHVEREVDVLVEFRRTREQTELGGGGSCKAMAFYVQGRERALREIETNRRRRKNEGRRLVIARTYWRRCLRPARGEGRGGRGRGSLRGPTARDGSWSGAPTGEHG